MQRHELSGPEIGLIGDIHTEDFFLQKSIQFFHGKGIYEIVCTGDVSDGMGNLDRCVELLKEYRVVTVLGNHDRWLMDDEMRQLPFTQRRSQLQDSTLAYLKSLPATISIGLSGIRFLLCHGVNDNDMNFLNPEDSGYALESNLELQELIHGRRYKLMVNGHTHRRSVRDFGNLWNINGGTLRRDLEPSISSLSIENHIVKSWSIGISGSFTEEDSIHLIFPTNDQRLQC